MDGILLDASRREEALYRQLLAVYARLLADVADDTADPGAVAAGHDAAERTAAALREEGAVLAPHRMGGAAVPDEVAALWRSSAELAAACLGANRTVLARARLRQEAVARRLAGLETGRRALGAYRPTTAVAAGCARCA